MLRVFERISALPRRVARAFHLVGELLTTPQAVRELGAQVSQLRSRLEQFNGDRDASIGELSAKLGRHISGTESALAQASQAQRLIEKQTELLKDLSARLDSTAAELSQQRSRQQLDLLKNGLHEAKNLLIHLDTSLQSRMNSVENEQHEIKNLLTHLHTSLHSRMNSLENEQGEAKNFLTRLDTSLHSRMNSLETGQSEARNALEHIGTAVDARLSALANEQFETRNLLNHLNTSVNTRLDSIESQWLAHLGNEIHEVAAMQLELRARTGTNRAEWLPHPNERYRRAKPRGFNTYLDDARRQFPRVYPLWKERLDATLEAFGRTKVGNAAHAGDVYSRLFRSFVEIHAGGRILDVGCGVFGRPYYLASYPAELVAGLDPLAPKEAADFEFVRGISEYLPWPDESFSTVISATSLDHCLSLDDSLAETQRVLRPGGRFLLWIASSPGSPKYEPDRPEFAPADQFHLFHFDVSWFEPMIERSFDTIDRLQLQKTGYSHVMYCLAKRESTQPERP